MIPHIGPDIPVRRTSPRCKPNPVWSSSPNPLCARFVQLLVNGQGARHCYLVPLFCASGPTLPAIWPLWIIRGAITRKSHA